MKRNYRTDLEVCEKATPGEWKEKCFDSCWYVYRASGEGTVVDIFDGTKKEDAEFIAISREALPYYIKRCMDLEAQVAQMMEALEDVDDSLENEGVWNDEVFVSWEVKNAIKQARKMALPVRWEAIQKVVEAAKEYMEAHKAWHGEENRFNKMVGLKDALAALEGGGE